MIKQIVCLILISTCTACISTWAVKNEPRDSVRFATADGAQIFYEAYLTTNYTRPGRPGVEVWLPVPYQHSDYLTDNIYFNKAVNTADANHDGVITDDEARIYAKSVRPAMTGLLASKN